MQDHHVQPVLTPGGHYAFGEFCRQAQQTGMSTLCLTAQLDRVHGIFPDEQGLVREFQKARERFPGLELLLGLDVEYTLESDGETALFIAGLPVDYVVNSVHFVSGENLRQPEFCLYRNRSEAYEAYLNAVFDSFEATFTYSVLGAITFVSRHAYYPSPELQWREFPDLLDAILRRAVFLGKGLEVDASTLLHTAEPIPSLSVLTRYRELGGELLTLGSHASVPEEAGHVLPKAGQLLQSCGFRYITVYHNMQPEIRPL